MLAEKKILSKWYRRRHKAIDKFIARFASWDKKISKAGLIKLEARLRSMDIVHYDEEFIVEYLQIPNSKKILIEKLRADKKIKSLFCTILSSLIVDRCVDRFILAPIKLLPSSSLHSESFSKLGIVGLKNKIRRAIKNNLFNQHGYFWHVLFSEKLNYVLKVPKINAPSWRIKKQFLATSPAVMKFMGADYFPRQAVLESNIHKSILIIQEKINLAEYTVVNQDTIDAIVYGAVGKKIINSFKTHPSNKRILRLFLRRAERMVQKARLLIDLVGSNLFIKFDPEDRLRVVLLDYGALKKWRKDDRQNIKQTLILINKLKILVQ